MLNVVTPGYPQRFCDRHSRRDALRLGGLCGLGAAGASLGLPTLLSGQARAAGDAHEQIHSPGFGKAKRVLLFFMWGGPAHQDTWDLKPHGPSATRGEFLPIATNVPGIDVSEHFPLLSRHADKLAIIRSVGQEDNNHSTGAHAGLTGRKHTVSAENFSASETDFPHIGSVLSALRPNTGGMPTFVALPEVIGTTSGAVTPGQGGGLIGAKFDPFRVDDHPDREGFSIPSLTLPGGMHVGRMTSRRGLLDQIESAARLRDRSGAAAAMDSFYQQALDMVLSPQARAAFDLAGLPDEQRMRYGWHTFGQSTLLARRLLEAGVQMVTVYWHREVRSIDTTWDTHGYNFQELKNRLMPAVDRPIAALLEDLAVSGLLEDTLVIWNSEFGRTPRINQNAGRDHWGPCNTVVMAGGGVPGGQVFGASDENAAYPTKDKVTQDDIAATIYHLLGIHSETPVYDKLDRPHHVALGRPIYKLLGGQSPPSDLDPPKPREHVPLVGTFTRMLRERGNRFIAVNLGNADSEQDWEISGWSEAAPQDAAARFRTIAGDEARLKYRPPFAAMFEYSHLVIRLASPRPLDKEKIKLRLNGRAFEFPPELLAAEPRQVWQLPMPSGAIAGSSSFELFLRAPEWEFTDLAAVGEAISPRHLAMV